MYLMYFVLLVVGFFAVFLLAYHVYTGDKGGELEKQAGLSNLREWSEETKLLKVMAPINRLISPIVASLPMPAKLIDKYQRLILSSGFDLQVIVSDMIGLQFVFSGLFLVIAKVWFGGDMLFMIVFSLLGLIVPYVWLNQTATERRAEILRELPSVVDMIGLSVGAGLEFNAAIRRVVERNSNTKSPLMYELRVYMQNIRLGMSTTDALKEFAYRVDSPEIYSFTGVLIQADKMGASISDTLSQQAARLREERFVAAEKAGAVAAQKIMLPMMLFIFPLVFAIIIAPLVLNYIYG